MSDQKLIDEASGYLGGDERVLAAGMFQPRGTTGGRMSVTGAGFMTDDLAGEVAGAVAGLASGQAMSRLDGVPRWTLLAVTPTTLHALACAQHGARWVPEAVFATFDRTRIRATVHARVNVRVLTIEDPDTGRSYGWEGYRFGPAHAKDVIEALDAEPVDPPPDDDA